MLKHDKFTTLMQGAVLGTCLIMLAPSANAKSTYVSPWQSQYPASLSLSNATPGGCQLCHADSSGSGRNAYGSALDAAGAKTNLIGAMLSIEGDDSDGDGTYSNLEEIDANTQPGWTVGDNVAGIIGDLDPGSTPLPVADISVDPLSIDFGAVTVDSSATDSVTISNVGDGDLTVNSLQMSGSIEFSISSSPTIPFTVAANTSDTVSIDYAPLNEGLDSGTLVVNSDSPGEETISIALSGTGVPVQVNECVPVVNPPTLAFGSVELGTSMTLTTTVSNHGTLDCSIDAIASGSTEFSLASSASFTVAPGSSVDVAVDYAPIDLGDDAGNITLTFPDRSIDVPLSGSGFEAAVEVLDLDIKSFSATRSVSLSKRRFAITIKLSVKNGGKVDGFADATLTGMQNGNLVHQQTLSVTDTRYTFDLYTPTDSGDIEWTVVIADDDPDDDVATAITVVTP